MSKTMGRGEGGSKGVTVGGVLLNLLPAAFLFLLFAAVGIVHVTSRVMVVDAGYRLSRLQQENRELSHANDTLKIELATLKSPLRLEKLAREQLGMAPPSAAAVVNLGGAAAPSRRASAADRRAEQARAARAERTPR